MLAELTIAGNVGRDAELRSTPSGKRAAAFSVATTKQKRKADGTSAKVTTWFKVVAWDSLADFAEKYIKKGAKVLVQGELEADPETGMPVVFKRENGTYGASYDVVASKIRMLTFAPEQEEIPF